MGARDARGACFLYITTIVRMDIDGTIFIFDFLFSDTTVVIKITPIGIFAVMGVVFATIIETKLLFRKLEPVALHGVTPFARGHVLNTTKILVSDFSDDGELVYEYTAPVIQVTDVKPYMCLLEDV